MGGRSNGGFPQLVGYTIPLILLVILLQGTLGQSARASDSTASGPASASAAAGRCQALTASRWPGVEITRAKLIPPAAAGTVPVNPFTQYKVPTALPEYCRVEGVIDRRKGAAGVEYGIGFALLLPANWNGRLLFMGGSGFNGTIVDAYGLLATGDEAALARGFAVVSSDGGHKGAPFDVAFLKDQQAAMDFALLAVPTVTHLGQELVTTYFGRGPHHTYSDGCSTGGREGMMAAERYPALFDGIIAGDPAMRSGNTRISGWAATVAFNRIAPKDAAGKPLPLKAFPAEDQKLLAAAVAAQCDGLDGLKDGLILNLAACRFDPKVLQCKSGKNAGCLSAPQVKALQTAFGSPRDALGKAVYPPFPYDLGLLGEQVGNSASRVPTSGLNPYNDSPSPISLDVQAELERARADPVEMLTDTADWTDLGSFYRRGGKIIFYHGASDPWYSLYDTLDYVQRNKIANPEFDASRFYSVPGMAHCSDGGLERFDLLNAIVEWVEHDKAPSRIIATDWTHRLGTRPLCPWPQYGRYKGSGDPKDAANFECHSD